MKKWFGLLLVFVLCCVLFTFAADAFASTDFGISKVKGLNLSQATSPGAFIANLIRWILGVVGVIMVAMLVYGGVTYATAAGNQERAESAKKILTYAIIGVAIVAVALIASTYIIDAFFSKPATAPATI